MTAATVPDVDLEAWLRFEREETCQFLRPGDRAKCRLLAEWLMDVGPTPGCPDGRRRLLACPRCHRSSMWDGVDAVMHQVCDDVHPVTWTERIRGPRS